MNWQEIILSALGIIITGLLSWGCKVFVAWLKTKTTNEKAIEYLEDALTIVQDSVKSTYQTYVEVLKDKNAFTADAQKEALNMAVKQCKSTMSTEVQEYITKNYGDLTAWIKTQIESALYDLKK